MMRWSCTGAIDWLLERAQMTAFGGKADIALHMRILCEAWRQLRVSASPKSAQSNGSHGKRHFSQMFDLTNYLNFSYSPSNSANRDDQSVVATYSQMHRRLAYQLISKYV